MPEDISVQILAQASDNIQKLFELSTRIDERVKNMQSKQDQIENRIDDLVDRQMTIMQNIVVLEQMKDMDSVIIKKLDDNDRAMYELDKRIMKLEGDHGLNNDRWNKIGSFVVQLVWVILAAYLLTKMNLQSPAVP